MDPRRADLVLEGGGVKGIALVGAVASFSRAGYAFPRVAGTSAGAVVGAFVAALQRAGEPLERLEDVARSLDYRRMRDRGVVGRSVGPLARVVDGFSLAFDGGVFEGDYLRTWMKGALADLGVRTFGDLRVTDDGSDLPPERRYGLVLTASDVSRRRLVRLPWDYPVYGLDADEQEVADAVRASASIPFFFEPVTLRSTGTGGESLVSTLVDGGVLSNFPIAMFDRTDGRRPRWPTFGVRLSMRPEGRVQTTEVRGTVSLALSLVETMLEACDAAHIDDPCVQARSVFVDTSGISPVDFSITDEQQEQLLLAGHEAAGGFLARWDWEAYLSRCRGFEP
ncbi:MAG TPA: patatin-like phospholipase family protein [Actinomycetes bacterium]|jgi:NTE family protein